MQCGATEYKGTTLGTTNQAFWYILLHLIEIEKWLKCLFYKGFEAKRRKRGWEYDKSTYPKGGNFSFFWIVCNYFIVLHIITISADVPALRVAAER